MQSIGILSLSNFFLKKSILHICILFAELLKFAAI